MKKHVIGILVVLIFLSTACIPAPTPYPYKPAETIRQEAQMISDNLQAYIEGWLDGVNPAAIPDSLIPDGITDAHSFELVNPDSVAAEEVWATRLAKPINTDSLYNSLPDPNVTYYLLGPALAPFGSKVHIEGEFPHCRFFSIQMSPPLSGEEYCYDRAFGPAEVSIVDADIEPVAGHTNPFRIGADRNATNRSYHVTYDLAIGNAVILSQGNFAPPYRYTGNTRHGGLLQYQGPWGVEGGFGGITPGNGEWNLGALWIRIYAPDGDDPFAGVAIPKIWYELPDGRPYFIKANFQTMLDRVNKTIPAQTSYTNPNPNLDSDIGWGKSYGILMNILAGVSQANGWTHPDSLTKVRAVDLGATGRSQFAPAPRNYEPHATTNNYAAYIGKSVRLDTGQVAIFTGKMPNFPDTRSDLNTMVGGQCRYWSLIGYDNDPFFEAPGSALNGIMDDEVILDEFGNYMICISRSSDTPNNATSANGISWVDWGPTMDVGYILRIVSVADGWDFDRSPNEINLPWSTGNLASPTFDTSLIFQNWHKGFMGCYLPRVHTMSVTEFEALGNDFTVDDIPLDVHNNHKIGLNDALNTSITASSTLDNSSEFAPNKANDDNFESYWSSQTLSNPAQTEWISIDLGNVQKISGIKLSWLLFTHATEYEIQVSNDNTTWNSIYETTDGSGGNTIIDHLQVEGRFIRLWLKRSVFFSYALNNFEVYTPSSDCFNQMVTSVSEEFPTSSLNTLKVFPNPTLGNITVQTDEQVDIEQIFILDQGGRIVQQSGFQENIFINGPKGLYFMVFKGVGQIITKRVIKQ